MSDEVTSQEYSFHVVTMFLYEWMLVIIVCAIVVITLSTDNLPHQQHAAVTSEGEWITVTVDKNQPDVTQHNRCLAKAFMAACCPESITTAHYPDVHTTRQYKFQNPTIQYFNDARDIKKAFLLVLEEAFAHKTMTWIGDSIMRQKYRVLIMMLTLHNISYTHSVSGYEMKFPTTTATSSTNNASSSTADEPAYEHIVECTSEPGVSDFCVRYRPEHVPTHADEPTWTEHPLKHTTPPHHHHNHNHLRKEHSYSTQHQDNSKRTLTLSTVANTTELERYKCHCVPIWTLNIPAYNIILHYVNLYRISIPPDYMPQVSPLFFLHGSNVMHYQMLLDLLPISDHVMVNVGLHEETTPAQTFVSLIRFLIDTLSEDMKKRPVTKRWQEEHHLKSEDVASNVDLLKKVPRRELRRHVFYLSEPVHFPGLHGYSDYFMRDMKSKPIIPSNETSMCRREGSKSATASLAEGLLRGKLNYIDPTDFLVNEGGFHMATIPGTENDCVHWCFIYEHYQARFAMIATLFSGKLLE